MLGHSGTTPGLNFVYAHLNRVIQAHDVSVLYVCGPGHGGPGMVANTYLEGTYSEIYPAITEDVEGLRKLFRQFSFPGGIPSHAAPETPGSIHECGELGYALVHAFGAAFDNPPPTAPCCRSCTSTATRSPVRRCCLGWLGIDIDPARNEAAARTISRPRSRVRVLALPTDEEGVIAAHCVSTG